MTSRKVASLSSSLLARKGAARPADGTAEAAPAPAVDVPDPAVAPPASERQSSRDAETASEPPVATPRPSPVRPAAAPEVRAYAWPTQGPPEDELAVPPPPPELELTEVAADPARKRRLRRTAVFVVAAAIVGGTWYMAGRDSGRPPQPSTVTAGASPSSVTAPVAETPPASVESIVASAVRDVTPSAGTPEPSTVAAPESSKPAAATEPPAAVAAINPATVTPPSAEPSSATTMEALPDAPAFVAPPPPEASAAAAAAAEKMAPKRTAAPSGRYALQLASVTSKARAQAEGARLGKRLSGILDGRKPTVEPAEIAGRGTVYRIRVNGFPSRTAAQRACSRIKAGGGDCMVVRH